MGIDFVTQNYIFFTLPDIQNALLYLISCNKNFWLHVFQKLTNPVFSCHTENILNKLTFVRTLLGWIGGNVWKMFYDTTPRLTNIQIYFSLKNIPYIKFSYFMFDITNAMCMFIAIKRFSRSEYIYLYTQIV